MNLSSLRLQFPDLMQQFVPYCPAELCMEIVEAWIPEAEDGKKWLTTGNLLQRLRRDPAEAAILRYEVLRASLPLGSGEPFRARPTTNPQESRRLREEAAIEKTQAQCRQFVERLA